MQMQGKLTALDNLQPMCVQLRGGEEKEFELRSWKINCRQTFNEGLQCVLLRKFGSLHVSQWHANPSWLLTYLFFFFPFFLSFIFKFFFFLFFLERQSIVYIHRY